MMDTTFYDVIKEIVRQCKKKDIEVTEDFVEFMVSLQALSSVHRYDEGTPTESSEKKVICAVVEKLLNQSRPSLITMKLQFHFIKHYRDRESLITKHRSHLSSKTEPLVKEISEVNKIDSIREMEVLYQKMLVVITLLSGLGNPTIPAVLREVAIGLQSVLQPSELPRYISLSKREKEEQLVELVSIVAGIRLFNRDCQRGGEDIDDCKIIEFTLMLISRRKNNSDECLIRRIHAQVPSILQAGVKRTRFLLIHLLETLMKQVYKLTAIVEAAIPESQLGSEPQLLWEDEPQAEIILWSSEMLVATRQQEIYVRKLLADLDVCEEEVRALIQRLQNRLLRLHETVKFRTAVPTAQVYPQFIEISEIWLKLLDEVIVLSFINDMLFSLQALFPERVDRLQENRLNKRLTNLQVLTDAERLESTMGKLIVECGECHLTYPSNDANFIRNFAKMNLQFLGFCAWKFTIGRGALIPGNPNIGIVEWKGKCFTFSSVSAAEQFGIQPDKCLYDALEIIRERQEFIHLFQVFKELQLMNRRKSLSGEYKPLTIRQDQESQTEVHVLPSFVDHDYSHSLWEHREKALHFAKISQCLTRSTQTYKSHFRTGISLQTLMPKDKEVQTRKEASTNTHNSKKFIFGLRTRQANIQIVDFSIEKK